MRTSFEREGDVRGTDLLAALVGLWREGATGSLQFSRSGATIGFELAAGEVIATQSSDPRFETASILMRAGKLDEATLARLAVPDGGDRALVALQAGILTRREWRWGEKIRAVELLSDLLAWLEGEYWLLRTPDRSPGEFRLPIPRLILELFLRSRDRGLVLHHLGGVDHPLSRSARFEAEFPTFGLTADAESVVRLIDGKSTAAEIASEAPADTFAVEKLLAALVTLGLVRPEFAAEAAAPIRSLSPEEEPAEGAEEGAEAEEEVEAAEEAEDSTPGPGEEEAEEPVEVAGDDEQRGDRTTDERGEPGPAELENLEAGQETEGVEIEEVVLDEPAAPASPGISAPVPSESEREERTGAEETFEDAAFDGSTSEDELERARMRFEPESAMAGAASEDLEAGRDAGDLDMAIDPGEPSDLEAGGGRPSRSGSLLVLLLVLLAAGVAAVLFLRKGGPAAPGSSAVLAPAAGPTPETTAVPGAAQTPPGALPAPSVSAANPPASPAPASGAKAETTPAAPARAARPTAAPAREARREGTRGYWVDRAARDQKRAAADRHGRFAVQLELACEVSSLVEAWRHDRPAGTMWVVTTSFQGRTCFRVLWGRYPSREAARRALGSAPSFFSTPRNHPMVVAIR
jgi:hypothetical protein